MYRLFTLAGALTALLFTAIPANGQVSDIFNGIQLGDSPALVREKVAGLCETLESHRPATVSFPLASETEEHLIGTNFSIHDGYMTLTEAVFVFADGRLVFIEMAGPGVQRLIDNEWYDGYRFYTGTDRMVIKEAQQRAWFLTEEALHPNLFAWSSPFLPSNGGREVSYSTSAEVPAAFHMGGTQADLEPGLRGLSTFVALQPEGEGEVQLNCFGIEFAGFPRKVEARFNEENGLYLLWILTGKQEEDRVRQALIATYGEAIYTSEEVEVFDDWRIILRKDRPEVAVVAPSMVPRFKGWIESQGGE
ncbi:MAG: hypothetical protein KDC54_18030 [Lewinella sp.]|nr:hypothetical protein [Lewinella sp.]